MLSIFAIVSLTSLIVLFSLATFQCPARAQGQQQKFATLKTQDHSLNLLFKNTENSVVQVTRKIPTLNLQNPQTANATALGTGIVYDTKGHVVAIGNPFGLDDTMTTGGQGEIVFYS
jgi:S1-C subfamily serine protease